MDTDYTYEYIDSRHHIISVYSSLLHAKKEKKVPVMKSTYCGGKSFIDIFLSQLSTKFREEE